MFGIHKMFGHTVLFIPYHTITTLYHTITYHRTPYTPLKNIWYSMFGHGAAYGNNGDRYVISATISFFSTNIFTMWHPQSNNPAVAPTHIRTQLHPHMHPQCGFHTYTTVAPIYAPTCPTTLYALIYAPTWCKSLKCCSNFREHSSFPISAQTWCISKNMELDSKLSVFQQNIKMHHWDGGEMQQQKYGTFPTSTFLHHFCRNQTRPSTI